MLIQLIIIQVITFTALVFALKKILYSSSFREIHRLQELHQKGLEKMQELEKQKKELELECVVIKKQANEKAVLLIDQAKEEVAKVYHDSLKKAKEQSEEIVAQAIKIKEQLRQEIAEGMKEESVNQAMRLVKEVVSKTGQELMHQSFVKELIEGIHNMPEKSFKVVRKADEIIVETAYQLKKEELNDLKTTISSYLKREIPVREVIKDSLVAGIVLKLDSFIINASLEGKLKEAVQALNHNL